MLARLLIPVLAPALLMGAALADDRLSAYISGGIGLEEREQFEASRDYFNLRLVFAARGSGEYLAAVRVRIADQNAVELLEAESEGPFFYARLAPGAYVVTARYGDEAQSRSVRLGEKGAVALTFYWVEPADPR